MRSLGGLTLGRNRDLSPAAMLPMVDWCPHTGVDRFDELEDAEEFPRIQRVRDVLVVPSPGHRANEQDWLDNPAVEDAVDLGNGVFLERLRGGDSELPEQVRDASTARGLNFEATRQFGQLYSFWREVPPDEHEQRLFTWDSAQAITEVLALSRFVLDNAHSFEFVGRVIDRSDGHRLVVPLLGYDGRIAYRARKSRFWFTIDEAEELRALLDRYRVVKDALPDRVRRALWHVDRSCYCRYIDEAVTNIATGLEALLNTDEAELIAAQFVKRSQALARELGIETSRSYWSWLYDVRSKAVHGAESTLVVPSGWDETPGDPPAGVAKIASAQDVLRRAIRKAIEEEEFRGVFESEESIRARFPIEPPSTDEFQGRAS